MIRLRTLWQNINTSLWFVPTLMVAAAMLLAYGLVIVDVTIGNKWVSDYPLLFGAGADGARGVLTAIAGSMMTVAALIFSLTLSTLAQVSSQYTSRVLRNFMGNRINQVVLGVFVSIFVYCLLVLRTIRGGDDGGGFIPSLAVAFGMVLALVSIGVLVFFIHHMASSVQAANIIGQVTQETLTAIGGLFPKDLGHDADAADAARLRQPEGLTWVPVPAATSGYVLSLDNDGLLKTARELPGVVRMEHGLGSFVAQGAALVSVARPVGAPPAVTDELADQLNRLFSLGRQRTIQQDAGFGLRQIVDIALKALSPGVNDTTTAVICIDYLGTLLARLGTCELGAPLRAEEGEVRVIVIRPTFAAFVSTAFDQIRVAGKANVAIYLRLLTALATVAGRTTAADRRAVLGQQRRHIAEAAARTLETEYERGQVLARLAEAEGLY